MKKKITLLFAVSGAVLMSSFGIMDDNGRAIAVGSPGESTCNQTGCHNSFTTNSGTGSVKITAPTLTNWAYTPGQTYAITVTVTQANLKLYGFALEALTGSGANAGTLTAGTGSVLKSGTISGNSRTSVTHALNGGSGTGSHAFTFNWKAPATNIGNITFYCAGNATNSSNSATGDYIYTTSQVLTSTVGIVEQHNFAKQINVFPNPTTEYIQIANGENNVSTMNIHVTDLKGAIVLSKQNITSADKIEVSNLNTGTYILKIESEGKVAFKQFIKE